MPLPTQAPVLTPLPGEGDVGLVDALAQLAFTVHASLGRIGAAHGLSIVQVRLLGILRDRRPTITELATLLQLDKSSVTGLVDRAQDRRLVQRVPSPIDGRSVQVVLTDTGRTLVDVGGAQFAAEVGEMVAGLSAAQQARLSAGARAVVAAAARQRGIELSDSTSRA